MANQLEYGTPVKIKSGMREFVGKNGRVLCKEGRHYRIRLDQPVEVPGVGLVRDDLWERDTFNVLRSRC